MFDFDFVNFEFDSNNDGNIDTYVEDIDTTGDGYYDTHIESYDTNNSGMVDTIVAFYDSTIDGYPDIVAKMHDYNQDGVIDSVSLHQDIDSDGNYDLLTKLYDTRGTGELDTIDVYVNTNQMSEIADYAYNFDPETGMLIPNNFSSFDVGGTNVSELNNFDIDNVKNPELISGNPESSMELWQFQGDTNRCALYSEKFVIEELTGSKIDIEDFAQIATENGWFTEEGGTSLLNMDNMLNYYGINNEMSFHNTIDNVEECLNKGGKVIVSIDADQIWYGKDNDIFSPMSGANHAVELIGIDHTDPKNPQVILNDSGSPNGKGEMIPLDVFIDAWEVGDSQMIVCYK